MRKIKRGGSGEERRNKELLVVYKKKMTQKMVEGAETRNR